MAERPVVKRYGPGAVFSFAHAAPNKSGPSGWTSRIATNFLVIGALLALIVAPALAHGEGVSVAAAVEVGFGFVQTDEPDTSSVDGIGEATFNFSGEKGPFFGQIEITIADTADVLDTAQHELVWHPAENLSIAISGHNFGIEPRGGNISVVNAPGGPVGDEEAFIDIADTGMLNIEYAIGTLKFGVALLDACVPDCGFTVDPEQETVLADAELQTAVVHLRREAEGLSFNLYFASSSGTFPGSQADGAGTAGGGGLLFAAGSFSFGLDFSAATTECATAADEGLCEADLETTQWGVAFTLAGLGAHYYFGEEETGADTSEITNIDVVYLFELADATVGPEFRTTTVQAVDGSETTDTFALFGMSMEF